MTAKNGKAKAKILRSLDDVLLTCRYLQHSWEFKGMYEEAKFKGRIVSVAVCQRCSTVREQRTSKLGWLLGSRYFYPSNYRIKGGVKAQLVRKEVIRRRAKRIKKSREAVLGG